MYLRAETKFLILFSFFFGNEATAEWEKNIYPNQILPPFYEEDIFSIREEMYVDELVQDRNASQFFTSNGVKKWQTLTIGGDIYLIGERKQGITLISLNRRQNSLFQINELPIDFNGEISTSIAFKAWSNQHQKFEAYIIIVQQPSTNSVQWFRINNFKLELVSKWTHDFTIKKIIHTEEENNLNFISFFECFEEKCWLNSYAYNFEQSTPHIWLLERLPLEMHTVSIAVVVTDHVGIIATVQSDTNGLTLYIYKKSCIKNCRYKEYAKVSRINATKVEAFSAYGNKYLAVSGSPSKLISINSDGVLGQVTSLYGITELMVISFPTNREDVIVLGKNSSKNVDVYTYSIIENAWLKRISPPCLESNDEQTYNQGNISGAAECLGRKQWSGATAIFANELPTIVFPGKKIEIIHVICSLRSSSTTQSSIDYVWLTKLGHQFQDGWRRFQTGLDTLLRTSSRNHIKLGENEINWNSVCDMNEELDKMTKLLHTTRLKLNSIDCSKEIKKPSYANERDADVKNGIIVSYRDFKQELEEDTDKIKGKFDIASARRHSKNDA
ncbi:female sterile (1) Nasrat isoform X2 [Rhodnius prolixus]|uniref:female sterile (1) Nasrat isoform X2 n=1 Tax=Rhodnius prolixus TaxID=13249 RepID=UPI003D18BD9D